MKISVLFFNEILSRKVMDRLGGWRCSQVSKYARDPKMIEGGGLFKQFSTWILICDTDIIDHVAAAPGPIAGPLSGAGPPSMS